jgi:hypothetical protein
VIFYIRVSVGGLVFGEGASIVPMDSIGASVTVRAAIDAMGTCLGATWRRGGWPLLHDHGCSSVVSDATGDSTISICGMDYRQDLDMVLPPGEDWDQRGMCCICLF